MFRFFIDRPRFAIVISLVILLSGIISYLTLPVEQFPNLTPPQVEVSTTYPGASAEVVEETVTALLEQEINGVPGMLYVDSTSSDDGKCKIRVTFEIGSDIDQKSVLVQNRIQKAMPRLPEAVKKEGVVVEAASPNMLVVINLISEDPEKYDELFLSNYATLNLKDTVARTPGVGRVELFGARDYGMRVWLDPDRLRGLNMSTEEVTNAILAQNMQLAGGRIGAAPAPADQEFQFSVLMPPRLASVEEFEEVVIRTQEDGNAIRVEDIARVELGAQNYDMNSQLNGKSAAALVVYQLPGSNALATVKGIEAQLDRLSSAFPEGVSYKITFDSTKSVEASIEEMMTTLYIAVGLVVLVVFIFLGGFRPTLVPAAAVPVSLIGTFALMGMLGFSINTLSLFGLILAIGIVVDDAILVVETSTRNIEEHGMQPKEAAIAAMQEVGSAVIASTLVLLAVFVPVTFIPGLTGRLFSQFALTISAAVVISTINALTLSPALASLILPKPGTPPTALAKAFNRVFEPFRRRYVGVVKVTLARKALVPLLTLAMFGATYGMTRVVPGGFLPLEDDGILMMQVNLPDAASLNRSQKVVDKVVESILEEEAVEDVISFTGYDILTSAAGSNKALVIVMLDDWSQRPNADQHISAVKRRIDGRISEVLEASAFSFQQPPIRGMGTTSGMDFELQDRAGLGSQTLAEVAADMVANANAHPAIARAVTSFRAAVPQVKVELDREQTARMDVPLSSMQDALSSNLAARYIDDLVLFGRSFRVMISGESSAIRSARQLLDLTAASRGGDLVPIGTLADVHLQGGPSFVTRFNLFPNAKISVIPAPGRSTQEAMDAMESIATAMLGPEFGYEWSGQAREQRTAGGATSLVFALSIIFVFLFLTAQYESFTTPISVMLMVPMAMFGAYAAQAVAGLPIDLYTQVGLVLLVGLTAKTAILLVELSKQQADEGKPAAEAAESAAHLRFRAVLMTALTFILGMLPLLVATGSGAASRVSLGTAVTGGTVAGIVFTLLLVPRLFVLVRDMAERKG